MELFNLIVDTLFIGMLVIMIGGLGILVLWLLAKIIEAMME